MLIIKSLKFLTMSVVFTLLFMGVGFSSNAQVTSSASAFDQTSFKGMNFVADKDAAIQLIKTEYAAFTAQAQSLSGPAEANNSLKLFFYEKVAVRLSADQSIPEALAASSSELATYATSMTNGTNQVSSIVNGMVDLLDL